MSVNRLNNVGLFESTTSRRSTDKPPVTTGRWSVVASQQAPTPWRVRRRWQHLTSQVVRP